MFSFALLWLHIMACQSSAGKPPMTGRQLYQSYCLSCHQSQGQGIAGRYPPLAGSSWVTGKPEIPIKIVLHGLQGEIEVAGKTYNNVMAPWEKVLSDKEIAELLSYVRNSWGNKASKVKVQDVQKIRQTYKGHKAWTAAGLKEE